MNIVLQLPACNIVIGIGQASGLADVPDARFIRYIPAGFISCARQTPAAKRQYRQNFAISLLLLKCIEGTRERDQMRRWNGTRGGDGARSTVIGTRESGLLAAWVKVTPQSNNVGAG